MDELNVKAGDKVIYIHRRQESIATVKKVTPTGRVKIDLSDRQFNKYGDAMGSGDIWGSPYIRKATPEDIKRIEQKRVILKAYDLCHTVETKKISYEKALKIIEILGDESNEPLA